MVKIGINGFGRIGRLVLRVISLQRKKLKCPADFPLVVALNDPYLRADHMANLFKYDSMHGLYQGDVTVVGSCLKVDDQIIEVSNERNPKEIPWGKACAEYIVEATGLFKSLQKAQDHIHDSVERVIITAPTNECVPMFVFGVNHDKYTNEMKVISNASCSTNCLAPICKVLHEQFTIRHGLVNVVHAVTASQNILDGPAKGFRKGRSGLVNIIPMSTGAAKAIGKIIPELEGKIDAMSARVPIGTGSMVDLTVVLENGNDFEKIKCRLKEASNTYLKGILGYTCQEIVSSDIIGDSRSSIVDAGASIGLTNDFIKVISWFDNEWGYSCRVVDMLKYMKSRSCKQPTQ